MTTTEGASERMAATDETETKLHPTWIPMQGKALALRTCGADMTASHDYTWPGVGQVAVAPDWRPDSSCGRGLHGLLWGAGDAATPECIPGCGLAGRRGRRGGHDRPARQGQVPPGTCRARRVARRVRAPDPAARPRGHARRLRHGGRRGLRHGRRRVPRHGGRRELRHGGRRGPRHGRRRVPRHGHRRELRHGHRRELRHGGRRAPRHGGRRDPRHGHRRGLWHCRRRVRRHSHRRRLRRVCALPTGRRAGTVAPSRRWGAARRRP
ncbi:MAG: hypothetical protein MZV70_03810 [Desulfobacterales bacterium]|nr:hypothetical protein [Desulfobacterales bacterium]